MKSSRDAVPGLAVPGNGSTSGRAFDRYTIADAVEKSAPSVVNITVRGGERHIGPLTMPAADSCGSGFVIQSDDANGGSRVVTNAHVVGSQGSVTISITTHDGYTYPARIKHMDDETDIAVLEVEGVNLPHLSLGQSDTLRPGEWAIVLGYDIIKSQSFIKDWPIFQVAADAEEQCFGGCCV